MIYTCRRQALESCIDPGLELELGTILVDAFSMRTLF